MIKGENDIKPPVYICIYKMTGDSIDDDHVWDYKICEMCDRYNGNHVYPQECIDCQILSTVQELEACCITLNEQESEELLEICRLILRRRGTKAPTPRIEEPSLPVIVEE